MIRKLIHIILSMILLLSTTGVAISKHYCGGELSAVEVGHEKMSCCDEPDDMPEDCCHDEQLTFLVEQDFQLSAFQFDCFALAVTALLPYLDLSALFDEQKANVTEFKLYLSPLIAQDIPVLLQSFLI
ncbi:hypothetical protein OKW21_000887 [Catalinimonas alkaloidigena]|uniref:HYC_CC_PP family protein n=1 Tax=Catalinimonas alkaloidigena TaxID=1075417 RepID=UPI00240713B0|nr:hypothetical protein [Catalinimonas alkaloidigena]MDF9795624.1 hypothetical protein [Catalinimonas alkaloidigena]